MAEVYVPGQRGRASRPTSAVEKTRSIREGGAMLRPASAGVWRGKPASAVLGSAMTSEESATSRSSASEASQQGAMHEAPKGSG